MFFLSAVASISSQKYISSVSITHAGKHHNSEKVIQKEQVQAERERDWKYRAIVLIRCMRESVWCIGALELIDGVFQDDGIARDCAVMEF